MNLHFFLGNVSVGCFPYSFQQKCLAVWPRSTIAISKQHSKRTVAVGIDKFEKHFSTPIGGAMILLKKVRVSPLQPHHLFLVLVERFFVEDNQFGSYFDMDHSGSNKENVW